MDVVLWNGAGTQSKFGRHIGPYKIAHWMRKHGHTAQVIDYVGFLTKGQLQSLTKKFVTSNTKILGISTTFLKQYFNWSNGQRELVPEYFVNIIKELKELFPNLKVVLGGYKSEKISGWGIVDATIMSYNSASEDVFLEYLEHLKSGSPSPMYEIITPSFEKTSRRLWYRYSRNPKYNIEHDDFKWSEGDCVLPGEPLPLDASRGCIFACRFCQYPYIGKKKLDYIRGMNYIEEELIHNYEKFKTTTYYMLDDTFNDTEFKLTEFYKMTQRLPFKIKFVGYLRADLIHRFPDTAYILQEAGLFGAFHGIESFHPEGSKIVGKAWSGKHGKDYLPKLYHDIWKRKIPMHTNFIVGVTRDTPDNVFDTVKWYKENNMHSIFFGPLEVYGDLSKVSIYYQSEFDKNSEKYGIIRDEVNPNKWKNDNWTSETAVQICNQVSEMVVNITKPSSWASPSLLFAGYTEDQIMNDLKNTDMLSENMNEVFRKFASQYYQQMISLS